MDPQKLQLSVHDPNSFSNPEEVRAVNLNLDWNIDFSKKIINGTVTYDLEIVNPSVRKMVLDVKGLKIKGVKSMAGNPLEYSIGEPVLTFGQPLTINIASLLSGKDVKLQIDYETTSECTALQWLDKEQTAGKKHPYAFSQCEPIHARSMLPCQDTPYTKATYKAQVKVPKELQALMSAIIQGNGVEQGDFKIFNFHQKVPIQSYLIAIAVGNLKGKKVGPRSTVWTEPEHLEEYAYEFAETENMLVTAEKFIGEYVWGIYDILVLPPSFPYGGMENPCLTFATPTLIAGDRSLVNVIYHEIAHSWTGNLVTNKNFQHFWLNEGFTVFIERKMLGLIHGESYRQLASIGGWKDLADTIEAMKDNIHLTRLVNDLRGVDPDDAFSVVPYEKGYAFLYYLEEKVGGPAVFEPFLKMYVNRNKYKSIDSNVFKCQFVLYFTELGREHLIKDIDWDGWFHTTGMPLVKPTYDTLMVEICVDLRDRWMQWKTSEPCPFVKKDVEVLIQPQLDEFLALLLEDEKRTIELEKLKVMEKVYNFNSIRNSEIRFKWLRLSIRAKWREQVPAALKFVSEQGRMKFVRPIYRELYSWEEVRAQTIEHFQKTRSFLMHVCATLVAKDLKLQ